MALGIFAGTGMDVKAAEDDYEIIAIDNPSSFNELQEICDFNKNDGKSNERRGYIREACSGGTRYVIYEKDDDKVYYMKYTDEACGYAWFTIDNFGEEIDITNSWYLLRKKVASPSNASNSEVSPTPHAHSYSWVTVQEANAGQDGIEEYRCSCGDVQGRNVIPASEAAVKGIFGEIKNAPQNGTATFDSGRLYTISDYVIKKLAERTDVTTVITFEYQNQAYKMTIPAGADFTGLLADEDYFYGYFFFANAIGATIEAL